MVYKNFGLRSVRNNLPILFVSLWLIAFPALANHGPEGRGHELTLHPSDRNIIYRGSINGLFQSTDGGERWQRVSELINFTLVSLLIDSTRPHVMYAYASIYQQESGIFKSTDSGKQWRLVFRDGIFPAMDPSDPSVLYTIKPREGIFKSMDAGDTWSYIGLQNRLIGSLVIHPVETRTLYVGGGDGVHKSTDGGESWDFVGSGDPQVLTLFLDPVDVNTLYGNVLYSGVGWRTAKSTDGGATWRPLTLLTGSLAIDPTDTRILYLGGTLGDFSESGLYKSSDGGDQWEKIADFFISNNVVLEPSDPRTLYAAASTGIAKSTDAGESWQVFHSGFTATSVHNLVISPIDNNIIYADIWKTLDAGESWSLLPSFRTGASVLGVDPKNPNIVYGPGTDQGQRMLKKSTDGGDNWFTILRENTGPLAVAPNDPDTLYTSTPAGPSSSYVFKSTDGGVNWTRTLTVDVRTIAIDPQDSRVLYVGTFRSGVYKSTDGGVQWNHSGPSGSWIFSITIDDQNPQIVYAAAHNGLFKSENGGGRWTRLGNIWALSLVIDRQDRNTLYAANDFVGVYKSSDGGQTWALKNRGLTVTRVFKLALARDTGRLYAATEGAGVWFSDDQAETWE